MLNNMNSRYNSVNGSVDTSGSALGSTGSSAQGSYDRHPATVHLKRQKNVGTWNVRSLYQAGKLENVISEMKRLKVDILGMAEVR